MTRGLVVATLLLAALAACRGKPKPTYEWGETVTLTHTDAPVPPAAEGAPDAAPDAAPDPTPPTDAAPATAGREAPVLTPTPLPAKATDPAAAAAAALPAGEAPTTTTLPPGSAPVEARPPTSWKKGGAW